jgi:hypothetical protein
MTNLMIATIALGSHSTMEASGMTRSASQNRDAAGRHTASDAHVAWSERPLLSAQSLARPKSELGAAWRAGLYRTNGTAATTRVVDPAIVRANDLSASAAVLVIGLPATQPAWLPSGVCAIHIDMLVPYAVLYPNLVGSGFDTSLAIPNRAELLDSRVVVQAVTASSGPLGMEVTGGLELTRGR